jgi:hypothetical protein
MDDVYSWSDLVPTDIPYAPGLPLRLWQTAVRVGRWYNESFTSVYTDFWRIAWELQEKRPTFLVDNTPAYVIQAIQWKYQRERQKSARRAKWLDQYQERQPLATTGGYNQVDARCTLESLDPGDDPRAQEIFNRLVQNYAEFQPKRAKGTISARRLSKATGISRGTVERIWIRTCAHLRQQLVDAYG